MREGVDVAIYEVGVGGENDSTKVIVQPAVTGITTLGIDHVDLLGNTVDKIAWHKAGIFKNQCPAFTVEQVSDAMEVLKERAGEKGARLATVTIDPAIRDVDIKPAEDFQRNNASLAIALAYTALEKLGVSFNKEQGSIPKPFFEGLETVTWRGRCETFTRGQLHWHLDGAHTEDSLIVACSWFGRVSKEKSAVSDSLGEYILIVLIFQELALRAHFQPTVSKGRYFASQMRFIVLYMMTSGRIFNTPCSVQIPLTKATHIKLVSS